MKICVHLILDLFVARKMLIGFIGSGKIAQALINDFFVDTYPGGYRYSTFNRSYVHSLQSKERNNVDYYNNYKEHLMTTVLLVCFS